MGDRAWTSIEFSGIVSREVADGLLQELDAQGCQSNATDSSALTIESFSDSFYDEECNYGTMEGVEAYCHEHHISFLKHWADGGGYGSGFELYDAVVNDSVQLPANEGEVCMNLGELKGFAKKGKSLDDIIGYMSRVEKFSEHYPPLEIQEQVTEGERQ
jgi:hypothetical protein